MEIAETADLQLKEVVDLYHKIVPCYNSLLEASEAIASGVRLKQFPLAKLKQLEPITVQFVSIVPNCRKQLVSAVNFFKRLKTAQKNGVYSNANGYWSDQVKSLIERLSPFVVETEDLLKKIKEVGITW